MGQIYFVQPGDSLWKIANRFGITLQSIIEANVICNKDWIYSGQLLVIPNSNFTLPKAGGNPYYIVERGDSLWCLHTQFNIPLNVLAVNNHITNPNIIYPEQELSLVSSILNTQELKAKWDEIGKPDCIISGFQLHGLYIDTFAWEAIGFKAIPYLLELINHPCVEVRFYAILSLGRIGHYNQVVQALERKLNDPEEFIRDVAQAAIRRIQRKKQTGSNRIHVLIWDDILLQVPNMGESYRNCLVKGTEVIVLRWFIPSPTGEEGPYGDFQYYDYVKVVATGERGFLPRWARGELNLI